LGDSFSGPADAAVDPAGGIPVVASRICTHIWRPAAFCERSPVAVDVSHAASSCEP